MADVVLVQPKIGDWDMVRSHPSLPLSLLSAATLVNKEFEILLIDMRTVDNWKEELLTELAKNPVCVGTTSLTGRQIRYALEISSFVQENSNVPVVWGGMHVSFFPELSIANKYIDFVIQGDGEITFLKLVRALKEGRKDFENIKGLWFKRDNTIIGNKEPQLCDLEALPSLPYGLVDLKYYLPKFMGRRTLSFETSRGCVNDCAFCYNPAYHYRRWRFQSAEKVLRNIIDIFYNRKINSFYIIDDNFFLDLARVRKIAEGIISERIDIYWESQGITISSALKMDRDYIRLLEKSGLKKVHFGVESGSNRIIKLLNKKIKVDDVLEVNRRFKEFDIILQYNFMSGFPSETIDDIKSSVNLGFELMKANKRAIISPICPYMPYPATKMYDDALKSGLKDRQELEDWIESDYGDNIWTSEERNQLLRSLFFASMFLDNHRQKSMIDDRFIKLAINLYRPIAKFRMKRLYFNFMPEIALKEKIFYRKDKFPLQN